MHARAARYLRSAGAPLPIRARHLEYALPQDDPRAMPELLEAASHTLATAPATSVRWIEAALRATASPAADTESTQLLLGQALLLSGSADRARRILEPLVTSTDSPSTTAVPLYARCDRMLGRVDTARNTLSEYADRLAAESGPLCLELAILELMDNREAEGASWVHTLFASGAVRDPAILAAALTMRSMGRLTMLDMAGAQEDYRTAEREFARLSDTRLLDGIHAVAALGWMAYFLDDQRTGLTHLERAIRVARRHGRSFILPELHTVHAYALAKLGRLDAALAATEDATETAELYGYSSIVPLAGALRLRVLEAARRPRMEHSGFRRHRAESSGRPAVCASPRGGRAGGARVRAGGYAVAARASPARSRATGGRNRRFHCRDRGNRGRRNRIRGGRSR
ncbi:tetratricopeptide repeat protein [Nocardia seriolae]|uniref:tetratricopeptide repeat protein n=2 Tax=Nocardia seriolae TaxID=37332 RepID=UPI000910D39A|nr:tetratricopeptide repeat protein [Nocardia seriolae]OJF80081.1 hypothetical protein NS14008_13860 [Nocardia seriolae]QOW35976.1 tetratricopeptide repeat protein [Nocardia seriolae]WNJ56405.1 tetratricopeptide repeat protein [Nocardia seriolae]